MKLVIMNNVREFVSTTCLSLFAISILSLLCLGTASAQSAKKNAQVIELPSAEAKPAKRIALVIGNHQYQRLSKLPNAGRDAEAMAVALKEAGFSTKMAKDLSYTAMVGVVEQFLKTINKGDEVVVFYSGHGVQIPKQGGYLLPIDVSTTSASNVSRTAYELEDLMTQVADAKPAFSMFIVDACRDNPFATKGVGTGFANPEAAQGQIVLFAASRNQQALEKLSDDDKDPNGVFTREFIKRMKTPGLEISVLMKEVQRSVETLAAKVNHEQRPAYVNEAKGNFYFYGPTTVQVNAASATAPDALELQFWQSTEKQNTKEAYLAYKKRYAKGQFVDLADSALNRIAKEEAALAAQAQRPPTATLPVLVSVPSVTVSQAQTPSITTTSPQSGQVFKDCADCPDMVVIPAGSFMMGSSAREVGRSADEGPQRNIKLKTFAMGKTEVTQGQYKAIMGSNPSYLKECGDDCPVENVSWDDAQAFIQKLNTKTGKTYSLPSESQWEYAARGTTTTAFHTGNTITPEQANFDGNYTYNGSAKGVYREKTIKVSSLNSPNKYGLHDMHGNVWEWTQDCYVDVYGIQPVDGSAYDVTNCRLRVLRGGSWNYDPRFLRSAFRDWGTPDVRNGVNGFRLARTLP